MEKSHEMMEVHPKGLRPLFLTEMWERLSFYGMRALLVLYLVKELKFSDESAGQVYGLYTSLVYLTPILGGYIADRYFGYKRSIYLGSILMLSGHLSLAIPGLSTFYLGLALLILGNGFFKPNMSTLVGRLYENQPNLRDSGYTIFYMGINLGGLIGPIICGSLGERVNWHYGFGAAGVGMAIGLLVFYIGTRSFANELWESSAERNLRLPTDEANSKKNVFLILLLALFSILFWMAFEQMGSSMNLFADRFTDRTIGYWNVPASILQSINPFFILLLSPIISFLWQKLGTKNPDPILKFVLSLIILGFGFLVMVYASYQTVSIGLVSIWFLFAAYFLNTLSELFLSPVGLSFVSGRAPVRFAGLLMGVWFLSNALGHYFAGFLSGYFSSFENLADFFWFFVMTSWIGAFVLFLIWLRLRSWFRSTQPIV